MRVKLDENLPRSLKVRLARLGHDVDTAVDEGLRGKPDDDVWNAAQSTRRLLVTLDLGFADLRTYPPGSHFGVVVARLPVAEQSRAADYLYAWFAGAADESWAGCLIVGTPGRLRIRRPE